MRVRDTHGAVIRVACSGVFTTVVDVFLLLLLTEECSVPVAIAAFVAALVGAAVNFTINKVWAFRPRSPFRIVQMLSFGAVAFVSAFLVASAVCLFHSFMGLPYLLAKAVGSVLVFFSWSYPAQANVVFV